ncbi:O-antigen ligase family protein [Prosthecobacter sp.]|uniref:O-antigen ligase family protein n=1 Tax=Prosthecobacter sp. TaxID=1965333 RepID=UPI003783F15C
MSSAATNAFAAPQLGRCALGGRAAQIALVGFVAGHAFLPNVWLHLGWLLIAGVTACVCVDWTPQIKRWRRDAGALSVILFLAWMTLRSCLQMPLVSGSTQNEVIRGILGILLLLMFCALVWQQSQTRGSLRLVGWATCVAAALAALISIVLCCFVLPGHHVGERLQNFLVHGGLNPVCTGLTFGFAALWLAVLVEDVTTPWQRRLSWAACMLLHFATFLSGSRGAMLAMAAGHAVLLTTRGWRRGRAALGVFLLTGTIYFTTGPLLALTLPSGASPSAYALQTALDRGDNGRLDIYGAGWHAVDNVWLGTGQWGVREVWQCELQARSDTSLLEHLHSAFFATLVHGGLVAACLLLLMLAYGIRRACLLAARGDPAWISLLAFGCAGLLFDGESLASLATAPRFEGLLFWLPLTVALARGAVTAPRADF